MLVLVTGHRGYIGPVVLEALLAAGHEVVGLDSGLFEGCELEAATSVPTIWRDLRDVSLDDVRGVDAIVHLANLSNDPLGTLDPKLTLAVNVDATVRLAELARRAGVRRFVNASSCSVYGAATEEWVDEATHPRPITAYGESKVLAERALNQLAGSDFCVTSLRNATAFGYSSHLRTDLVVNDLVAGAYLHGEVKLNSDGTAWRPLVHIRDIALAITLTLAAPPDTISGQVFNVGADEQNYRVIEIARTITECVPGARLAVPGGAGADRRSYRVRFGRIRDLLPDFRCQYDLLAGVRELDAAFRRLAFTPQLADQGVRLAHLQRLRQTGAVASDLRRKGTAPVISTAA